MQADPQENPDKSRRRYVPCIDDKVADKAIVEDIMKKQKKLEALKTKYPEMRGIRPADSPNELFDRTRINSK